VRILLTGATGLIGSGLLAGLTRSGHEVTALARGTRLAARLPEAKRAISLDIATATHPGDWIDALTGIDAVVNCAGVLQDASRDTTAGVHVAGPRALFAACESRQVRRVVQISAVGVDRCAHTEFARTKLMGDELLMASELDWVILRPSVVVGRAAYGGSALLRGLAALPLIPTAADAGRLQIVQLDDLVETVLHILAADRPQRMVLEIVGPERLSLEEVIGTYRRWLGLGPPRFVRLPRWLETTVYWTGDVLGRLGWRPALRSTVREEMRRGAIGDGEPWRRYTGLKPTSLAAALAAEPASVQERWFARLYFLKPLTMASLAGFWIAVGAIGLWRGEGTLSALLSAVNFPERALAFCAGAEGLGGMLIGMAITLKRTARMALRSALALAGASGLAAVLPLRQAPDVLLSLTILLPMLALTFVALAILDDR